MKATITKEVCGHYSAAVEKPSEGGLRVVTVRPPSNCISFDAALAFVKREIDEPPSSMERVIAWMDDPKRKPPHLSFTEGLERQIAYRFWEAMAGRIV